MSTVQCKILIAALYSPFSPAKVRTHIVPQGSDTDQAVAAGRVVGEQIQDPGEANRRFNMSTVW